MSSSGTVLICIPVLQRIAFLKIITQLRVVLRVVADECDTYVGNG